MQTRDHADILSGLALAGVGAFFAWFAMDYRFGSLARIGPAFAPLALGIILMCIGAAIALLGLMRQGAELPRPALRPLFAIGGAILAFALAIQAWGLIPAALVLVGLSVLAEREFHLVESVLLAVSLAALSYVIFLLVLGLPIQPVTNALSRALGLS